MSRMPTKRTQIATGGTIAALGCLTAVAMAFGVGPQKAREKPLTAVAKNRVKTLVVHRTVGVLAGVSSSQPATAAVAAASPVSGPAGAPRVRRAAAPAAWRPATRTAPRTAARHSAPARRTSSPSQGTAESEYSSLHEQDAVSSDAPATPDSSSSSSSTTVAQNSTPASTPAGSGTTAAATGGHTKEPQDPDPLQEDPQKP